MYRTPERERDLEGNDGHGDGLHDPSTTGTLVGGLLLTVNHIYIWGRGNEKSIFEATHTRCDRRSQRVHLNSKSVGVTIDLPIVSEMTDGREGQSEGVRGRS